MTGHLTVLDYRLFKRISYFMPPLRPHNTVSVSRISVALDCYSVGHLPFSREYSSRHASLSSSSIPTAGSASRGLVLRAGAGLQNHHILPRRPHLGERLFSISRIKMASDEDYMSFLDKANKDPSEGYAKAETEKDDAGFRATEQGVEIPRAIKQVISKGDAFYVSDADEPFQAVALKLGGSGLPDEEEFARLINHPAPKEASVEILDPVDWDRNGQYAEIIDAVRESGEGNDVRVYRVARGGVKAEYWVITATNDEKLVGVKALAVES
ncbi:hypothetical protein V8F33_012256 [Rhypophila sp. PSN 637]